MSKTIDLPFSLEDFELLVPGRVAHVVEQVKSRLRQTVMQQ